MKRRAAGHAVNLDDAAQLTAWTTPQAHDATARGKGQKPKHGTKHGCADLNADAVLAGWPSPMAGTPATERYNEAGNTDSSRKTVDLASWATPRLEDGESAGMRHARQTADTLSAQAGQDVGSWPSPNTRDHHAQGATHNPKAQSSSLATIAQKKAPPLGMPISGSPAATGKPARFLLNPRFSLWLMGYPTAWASCGERVTRSTRRRQRRL